VKRGLKIAAGLMAILLLAAISSLLTLRTAWFQHRLRARVESELSKATGGRVQISSMQFDSRTWRVRLEGVTIRGLEAAGQPPLLHAAAIQADLKIVSFVKRQVNLAALRVDAPEIRVLVGPDGATNIPGPQRKMLEGKLITEDLIDLAVGRFELEHGILWWNDRRFPLDLVLERLQMQVSLQAGGSYAGNLEALGAVVATPPRLPPVQHLALKFNVFRDRIEVGEAFARSDLSDVRAHGAITHLLEPHSHFDYEAAVDARDASRLLVIPEIKSGHARMTGSLDAQGDRWAVTGRVSAQNLAASGNGFRLSSVSVDGKYQLDSSQIRVDDITARLLGGAWKGHLTADYAGRASLDGRAEGIRFAAAAQALPDFPIPLQKLDWASLISGPVNISGICPQFCRDLHVKADLTLALGDYTGSGIPVSGVLRGVFHDRSSEAQVDELRLMLPGAALSASGRIGKGENGVQFHLDATRLDPLIETASVVSGEKIDAPVQLKGRATAQGRLFGTLEDPEIDTTLDITHFVQQGREWDSLNGRLQLSRRRLRLIAGRLAKGNTAIHTDLTADLENGRFSNRSPFQADISVHDADLQDVAALAGQKNPVNGRITASAKIDGSVDDMRGSGRVEVRRGTAWGESFDTVRSALAFRAAEVRASDVQITKGRNVLNGQATFDHRKRAFTFIAHSDRLSLEDWRQLANEGLHLSGNGTLNLAGAGRLSADLRTPEEVSMEGDLRLRNIALDGQPLGALALVVRNDGSRLRLRVQSDFTNAEISGEGEITPRDRFPVQGHLEFRNVDAASVLQVLKKEAVPVRIAADGEVSVSGDAVDPEGLRLGGTVTRLTVNLPENTAAPRLRELRNPEPVRWRVANRTLFVESAHLVGEGTDLRCSGSAAVSGPVNFAVKGSLNLAVFGSLGPNLDVKGISVVDAAVTGQMQAPDIRGNLEIRNASVGSEDLPLSLNNVNGAILFSRYAATVQKLSGEAGGGQIAISGDASFLPGRPITYRLRADARQIRLRYPRGVSSTFEGALSFTGTNQQSLLAGEIRITRAATRAAVDLTGLLASLKEPTRTPSRNDWLQDAQLNVTISTAPDIRFDTSLARNLQADASLRLRGTVLNPALLGRINLTQGEFEFQGSRYTINRGDITFSNPIRIEPILNLDLETKASGYDIVLTLAGPLQKLNVSYRSDPPLPFNEVITLLALGRSPTSDTSIAAQQLEQTQGLSQIGASGVIGQAISQPVSGRLQRFFGVSRLKLDPELVGPEGNPNARVTLEQQVSKDVTFTYIYNLASVQEQIVRVQWSLSSQLSVVAVRDQNGVFGIDFLYRRRYR